jgi:hypothetical protein
MALTNLTFIYYRLPLTSGTVQQNLTGRKWPFQSTSPEYSYNSEYIILGVLRVIYPGVLGSTPIYYRFDVLGVLGVLGVSEYSVQTRQYKLLLLIERLGMGSMMPSLINNLCGSPLDWPVPS